MAQGSPRQGCVLFPLLFNVLFAAILLVELERFSKDAGILADLIHLQEQPSKVGLKRHWNVCCVLLGGVLYADDARIVSRSPRGLGRMMVIFVEVFGKFGLTISESTTETMCTGNEDSLQRHGAAVPPDNLLRLFGRHSSD